MPMKKKEKKEKSGTKGPKKIVGNLNPQQELFCHYFALDGETFGNATRSYIQAYGLDAKNETDYNGARRSASALLTNLDISARLNELLDLTFTDEMADMELAYVARQKEDLSAKVAAIREWNKVKNRITDKVEIKGNFSLTELLRDADARKKNNK